MPRDGGICHPPAHLATSLGMLRVGGTPAVTGEVPAPPRQAVPSECFSNCTDILSRLSSICFLILYGN